MSFMRKRTEKQRKDYFISVSDGCFNLYIFKDNLSLNRNKCDKTETVCKICQKIILFLFLVKVKISDN